MSAEKECIRELSREVAEIAHSDKMQKRRQFWARHNNLEKVERPPVMCRPVGAWDELVTQESLLNSAPLLRDVEFQLRQRLYKNSIDDDEVIDPWVIIPAAHLEDYSTMWGINIDPIRPEQSKGAFHFKPEIVDEADIEKLKIPDWNFDESKTEQNYQQVSELLDDRLAVLISYQRLFSASLTYWGAYMRGIEQMMYDCVDRPQWLHRFIKFLSDATIEHWKALEEHGHICRNDYSLPNDRCFSCKTFPSDDFDPAHVKTKDLWFFGDAQEFTLASPAQWDEFVLSYQAPIFEMFGLIKYGCCESMVGRLEILKAKVPNLRIVTVSPWSDIEYSAEQCQKDIIMEIRPKPTDVLMNWGQDEIKKDIQGKMELAGDTIYEFDLQDIETVNGNPEILTTWVRIAKEVGADLYH